MHRARRACPAISAYQSRASRPERGEKTGAIPPFGTSAGAGLCPVFQAR